MKFSARIIGILIFLCAIGVMAGNALSVPQDDKTRRNRQQNDDKDKNKRRRYPTRCFIRGGRCSALCLSPRMTFSKAPPT